MKKKNKQPECTNKESWEDEWFSLPYSKPPTNDKYLICPACSRKDFICRDCGLLFIRNLLKQERKPDRTTEESEGEYVLCSITDSIFKTHLLKEDPLCRKLFLQNVRDYLKSERKKLAKQIINEIAVMTIYEDHETPPAGQIIKMIKEKALND